MVNHAAVQLFNDTRDNNEFKCQLPPLDTISRETRNALREYKSIMNSQGRFIAEDIVLQINKTGFRDGKEDPNGFKVFLHQEGVSHAILP